MRRQWCPALVLFGLAGCTGGRSVVAPVRSGTIVRGQIVSGRLTLSDARLGDNSLYQAWAYMGRAGETIVRGPRGGTA